MQGARPTLARRLPKTLKMFAAVVFFVLATVVVVIGGTALARYGDAIAARTRLGHLWVGAVLVAGATSLPELATDITAVRLGVPDLAAGDLFGSSMANMLVLALVDLMPPRGRVLRHATLDNALAASLAIVLNALAAVFVLANPRVAVGGVGIGSVVLLLIYIAGTRAIYRHVAKSRSEREPVIPGLQDQGAESQTGGLGLRRAIIGFALAATAVFVAAPWVASSAKDIAEVSGLGNTFVGTWLVGFATSLPELAAAVAAVRLGAFDLAVGNLFGSNGFNMAIFFFLDLAHSGGPVFAALQPQHALSGLFAVVLSAMGLSAIVYRAERRFFMLEPDSAAMVVVYLFALWFLYTQTALVVP